MESRLDHERLEVYALAREFAREGHALTRALPGVSGALADQFRRATLSIALNIAEGAGEFAARDKARFYRYAKRSATECSAVLDHLVDLGIIEEASTARARTLIRRVTGALVRLIQATEARGSTPRRRPSPAP